MSEKGWTLLAAASALATFLGLCYIARLIVGLFFGLVRGNIDTAQEAPLAILIAQAILIGGIVVVSVFPKLLMDPISAAIDPQFASTLVWEGQSLQTIYGLWNPVPVMILSLAAALGLAGLWWLLRTRLSRADRARTGSFEVRALRTVTPPLVIMFWRGVAQAATHLADGTRRIYSGNGQRYAALVLLYFLVLYFLAVDGSAIIDGHLP